MYSVACVLSGSGKAGWQPIWPLLQHPQGQSTLPGSWMTNGTDLFKILGGKHFQSFFFFLKKQALSLNFTGIPLQNPFNLKFLQENSTAYQFPIVSTLSNPSLHLCTNFGLWIFSSPLPPKAKLKILLRPKSSALWELRRVLHKRAGFTRQFFGTDWTLNLRPIPLW